MNKIKMKRIISFVLTMILVCGLFTVTAHADNQTDILGAPHVDYSTPTTIVVAAKSNCYYRVGNDTYGYSDWKLSTEDNVFSGLYPNTEYKVSYKYGTDGNVINISDPYKTEPSESHADQGIIDSDAPFTLAYTGYINSFELNNDLSFRYYVPKSKYADYTNVRVYVERQVYEQNNPTSFTWSSQVITPTKGDWKQRNIDCFLFVVPGIGACELANSICVTLYADDADGNTYITPIYETTMQKTALSFFGSNEKMNRLTADFLNYAAACQLFFNYNTNNLANANSANVTTYATSGTPTYSTISEVVSTLPNAKATYTACNLEVSNKIGMMVYAKFDDSVNKNNVSLKLTYNSVTYTYPLINNSFFRVNNIIATDFDTPVVFTIYEGATPISMTMKFSIESCAYSLRGKSASNPTLVNALDALIKYSHSAALYFSGE